jgi:hypothetical protein
MRQPQAGQEEQPQAGTAEAATGSTGGAGPAAYNVLHTAVAAACAT